jgi:capsular polysaccharide transport system permease protein
MPATVVPMRTAPAATGVAAAPEAGAAAPGGALPAIARSGGLAACGAPPLAATRVLRARLLSLRLLSFVLVVMLPTGVAAVYYLLVAADQFEAEFRFGLRSSEPVRADGGTLLPASAAPLQVGLDSYAVAQYIGSRAIIDELSRTLDLRRMFASAAADWPARLHLPVSAEEFVAYWRGQVDAFFDPTNGTVAVRVRAFSATDAEALARAVLAASERLVNDLSARARRDAVRNAERDVAAAEGRLTRALARLRDYRDAQGLIDPHQAAQANAVLSGRLRDELVRAGADLSTLKQYLQDDAPPLKLLEARIQSLKAEQNTIESEATATAATRHQALSRVMGSYEELEGERRFAEAAYQHALEALDRARANADRQQVYLADFVPPSRPEEALYPRRWRALGIVLLAAFVVWAIGNLTVSSVRDHL